MDDRFGINTSQFQFVVDWLNEHGHEKGLEKLGVGDYGAGIRFMDWQAVNASEYIDQKDEPVRNATSSGTWQPYPSVSRETILRTVKHFKVSPWIHTYHKQYPESIKELMYWYMIRIAEDESLRHLPIYFEPSNELWNSAPAFKQYVYAVEHGNHPSKAEDSKWAVVDFWMTKIKQMRWALDEIIAENPDVDFPEVKIVLSVQHRWDWWAVQMLNALSGRRWVDCLAIAPYYGWWIKDKMPSRKELYIKTCAYLRGEYTDGIKRHAELAKQHGLQLLAYEGGQHFSCELHLRDKLRSFVNSNTCYALEELAIHQWLEATSDPALNAKYFRYSMATPHYDIEYEVGKFRRGELWGLSDVDNFGKLTKRATKRESLIRDLGYKND